MQYLNVSGFWKPSVKSNIFVYFHQHSIGNRNIKVGSCLHLKLVHCIPGLGDVDLIAALHFRFSPFDFFRGFSSAVIALPLFHGISLSLSGKTGWKNEEKGSMALSRLDINEKMTFCFSASLQHSVLQSPYPCGTGLIAPTKGVSYAEEESQIKRLGNGAESTGGDCRGWSVIPGPCQNQKEKAEEELIEYIDYYNNKRIKARLKGLPPALHR